MVRVATGEDERYLDEPLFEAIVRAAEENGLLGAVAFKGFMGYTPGAGISTAGIVRLAENLPIMVEIVGEEERVLDFLPLLERAVGKGAVTFSDVEIEEVGPERGSRP